MEARTRPFALCAFGDQSSEHSGARD